MTSPNQNTKHTAPLIVVTSLLTALAVGAGSGCGRPPKPAGDTAIPEPGETAVTKTHIAPDASFFDAAHDGKLGPIVAALNSGVDASARNSEERTALMLAAFNGHGEIVGTLLDAGARVADRDPVGRTALMYASTGPDVKTVELLLSRKADVNAVDSHEHWSPLMFAATEGHLPVIHVLLKYGANPVAVDDDGDTPSSFARQAGHAEVVAVIAQAAVSQKRPAKD